MTSRSTLTNLYFGLSKARWQALLCSGFERPTSLSEAAHVVGSMRLSHDARIHSDVWLAVCYSLSLADCGTVVFFPVRNSLSLFRQIQPLNMEPEYLKSKMARLQSVHILGPTVLPQRFSAISF